MSHAETNIPFYPTFEDSPEELGELIVLDDFRTPGEEVVRDDRDATVLSFPSRHQELEAVGQEQSPELILIKADAIPQLHFPRQRRRQEAEQLIGERHQLVAEGKKDQVPLEVNAMGSANRVAEAEALFGSGSPEHKRALQLLLEDTERLVQEAWSRTVSDHYEGRRHEFSHEADSFMSHGYATQDMTRNALTVVAQDEEGFRRINEHVEDGSTGDFLKLKTFQGRPVDEFVWFGVTQCPNWAIQQYKIDVANGVLRSYAGYVPSQEKLGARLFSFDSEEQTRTEEQTMIPGLEMPHELIVAALQKVGFLRPDEFPTKTELHGMQFISHRSMISSSIDVTKMLDQQVSEITGKRIFMGKEVDEDHHGDYDIALQEFEKRRERQQDHVQKMFNYILLQKERGVSDKQAMKRIVGYLEMLMHEVAEADPDQAEQMFDENTAENYREVQRLMAEGDIEAANEQRMKAISEAPPAEFCGSDCGVEELKAIEASMARALGMREIVDKNGNRIGFLRAKEAVCECGSKRTVIGLGQKGCLDCKKVQDIGHLAEFMKKFNEKREAEARAKEEKDEEDVNDTKVEKLKPQAETSAQPTAQPATNGQQAA